MCRHFLLTNCASITSLSQPRAHARLASLTNFEHETSETNSSIILLFTSLFWDLTFRYTTCKPPYNKHVFLPPPIVLISFPTFPLLLAREEKNLQVLPKQTGPGSFTGAPHQELFFSRWGSPSNISHLISLCPSLPLALQPAEKERERDTLVKMSRQFTSNMCIISCFYWTGHMWTA